ncbi:uncharacterized protein Z520_10160 [Fonsecaea multimorphosa CBS 102226]|uniref:Uncharacterized protein n=1 Tax=Fonsecaea multimorphosa CBS 102226 TaxID=1442371 RepID=A0A0D2JUE8_9EURO|nr:uncharacterized protein Z520_10160 [Fonsecaea multimorphosa CBS 102226]KIX94134.1 hypothetical protein Z520_10160 [Fonsecaea multimorphosa CBS 102226]OAL19487.1 hypothetical protein AYO22_09649 [Fonsecaea multimorphosa]
MGPSLLSKSLQAVGVGTFASIAAFSVWTKHCHFSSPGEFNPATEPLFKSVWFRKFNPGNHEATYDECVRRIGLQKIRPELVEDSRQGGTKLVEEFCRGVWGGAGYTIQRMYLARKYRNDTTTAHQLWSADDLGTSTYEPGTEITDHFVVLDKTPTRILIRCGDSPLNNPDKPRPSDGLFEMCATADFDKGVAEFRLKSIFYVGEGEWASMSAASTGQGSQENWENRGPMQGWMLYAHKLYTKLWMESALRRVKQ